jgi:hypothetical protein
VARSTAGSFARILWPHVNTLLRDVHGNFAVVKPMDAAGDDRPTASRATTEYVYVLFEAAVPSVKLVDDVVPMGAVLPLR